MRGKKDSKDSVYYHLLVSGLCYKLHCVGDEDQQYEDLLATSLACQVQGIQYFVNFVV